MSPFEAKNFVQLESVKLASQQFRFFGTKKDWYLILGGVHGDEPEGVIAAGALTANLMQAYPYSFNLCVVPQVNPFGVMTHQRGNHRGVDLNRNMATRDWSPEAKTPRYNPGPSPNSELETRALIALIDELRPKKIISLHSWHPVLNINGDCREEAEVLARETGYRIDTDIGYPTPGSLGTWAGLERDFPTLTYEIERGQPLDDVRVKHVAALGKVLQFWEDIHARK